MRNHSTRNREPLAVLRRAVVFVGGSLVLCVIGGCEGKQGGKEGEPETGPGVPEAPLEDDAAKASYSLGYRFAENVRRQFPADLRNDAFVRGVQDQLSGEEAQVTEEESERVLKAMMEARQADVADEALRNLEQGQAFLEENAGREAVVTLDSGLQYEVLERGEGPKPDAADVVTTHYEGRLIDGTVFDSSYQRGEPASFPLNRVIPGWTQGVQLMSPGAKYRLYVPAELAYGNQPAGAIPPNSTLIFDVELIDVETAGQDETDPSAASDP